MNVKTVVDSIRFAQKIDLSVGVDNLDLYGENDDRSYDGVLRKDTEFNGILWVQKHLDHQMQLGYEPPLELRALGDYERGKKLSYVKLV